MQTVSRQAVVPYSLNDMYRLVNDIEAYPQFLPWCTQAHIHEKTPQAIVASLHIQKGGIGKRFTTRNTLSPGRIDMQLIEGPFKYLKGAWQFTALNPNACKIEFQLEFEFSNTIMQMLLNSTFQVAANTLLNSFCERAKTLYGTSHAVLR